jgi:hypothetical protein
MIDWSDETCQVTSHFTVKDCLYLHGWQKLACVKNSGVKTERIVFLCQKLEEIRALLNYPINVHSFFRSISYNESQGIKPSDDVHSESIACDFDCAPFLSIQEIKDKLRPHLEILNIRMEKGTETWVHVDIRAPGPSGREFTP